MLISDGLTMWSPRLKLFAGNQIPMNFPQAFTRLTNISWATMVSRRMQGIVIPRPKIANATERTTLARSTTLEATGIFPVSWGHNWDWSGHSIKSDLGTMLGTLTLNIPVAEIALLGACGRDCISLQITARNITDKLPPCRNLTHVWISSLPFLGFQWPWDNKVKCGRHWRESDVKYKKTKKPSLWSKKKLPR